MSSPITPSRTRVKICGITRIEDALLAANLGADAIGLVFYAPSPRAVHIAQAREIVQALPPFVTTVGLFVNAKVAEVQQTLQALPLDLLQFHGEESPEYCAQFNRPYIKAIRMQASTDLVQLAREYATAHALLLDTYVAGVQGGTGIAFDWQQVPREFSKPLILAGGLNPENVQAAISQVRPYAVDVSGGVEASKGIKDPEKLIAFMRGAGNDNQ
ncbi:MAG: phosphoribosylanthranilate isomerase [Thiotrichaceae bacterium]|nr:phosphoribosylanthranilate isomerase [Thiotrichaceae bacterium]